MKKYTRYGPASNNVQVIKYSSVGKNENKR
jgi:hypothetical protein